MRARVSLGAATVDDATAALGREGCSAPRGWSNGPHDRYGWHEHDYHKVLFCLEGSIVFHTDEGDVGLQAGDRLDLAAGTTRCDRRIERVSVRGSDETLEPDGAVARTHP